jgi:phage baseplate assembly protein W
MLYSDLNENTPTAKPLVEDIEAITQSIRDILDIAKGEVLFLPELGASSEDYLFEDISEVGALLMTQNLINEINIWDDRIILDQQNTYIVPDYDNNAYNANIVYQIKGFSEEFSFNERIGTA